MFRPLLSALCLLALALLPTGAFAQYEHRPLPGFELERLQFDPGALGSLVVGTGRTLGQGVFRASVQLQYEQMPLSFEEGWDPQAGLGVVEGKFSTHVTAAYGVLPWLQVGAQLPFILNQSGSRVLDMVPPAKAGLGTPWLGVRAGLLQAQNGAPLNLAVDVSGGLPVGSSSALAREGFMLLPRLQAGLQSEGFQMGADLGVLLRSRKDFSERSQREHDVLGNELRVGATVTSLGGKKTRGEVSALVGIPLSGGQVGGEVLLAIRRHALPWLDLYVLGGPGLGRAMDMPTFRVIAGASFSSVKID
ncbi:flagellar motor protein MotB [Hyalangium rubrum]|uniref:Flagellar motor protein MotB n=1 Tax=Hyalangium rubrum TaxID=3103134 RepID=A0ABU5GWP4_9BACT|nr:flagellar motor protein MotB [Hyalangium sp. s54d21]MDY7225602.1 flagellar motor protein MotB [Hyalangium sp. s54d21]